MIFKMDPNETVSAQWHEVYVSFDEGKYWFAIGGGDTPIAATKIITWYRAKFND